MNHAVCLIVPKENVPCSREYMFFYQKSLLLWLSRTGVLDRRACTDCLARLQQEVQRGRK